MRLRTCVLMTCLVVVGACARVDYQQVSLAEEGTVVRPNVPGVPRAIPLRVAIAAVISPQATFEEYGPLLDYLAEKFERPVQLLQRRTYAETNELLRTGYATLGFICGGAYVHGYREFGMELLVVPEVRGETHYHSDIIVPYDSKADSIVDLRGRKFAFSDPLSNSGYLAPAARLREIGERPERFFSSTNFTYSHDNSIRAVANRLVEGAAVDSLVLDLLFLRDPTYRTRVRIIERLGPYANPPVVVHPDLDQGLKDNLRGLFLKMASDPAGKAALDPLAVDRFVVLDEVAYRSIYEMAVLVHGWVRP